MNIIYFGVCENMWNHAKNLSRLLGYKQILFEYLRRNRKNQYRVENKFDLIAY